MPTNTAELARPRPSRGAATHRAREAAAEATARNSSQVTLPYGIGVVTFPAPQRLAWYGGVVVVASVGVLEWPVAAILIVGHLLAEDHHNRLIHDFGEGLSEA